MQELLAVRSGRRWVFTPGDLAKVGNPRSLGMALTRLSRKGIIHQLARGLYDYPIDHPSLGQREIILKRTTPRNVAVEEQMRLQAASVEKDFWVCWTLRAPYYSPLFCPR